MTSILAGLALLAIGAAGFVARYLPIPGHKTIYLVIASPFMALAALVAVVVLLWGRHWLLAALAGVVTAAFVTVQVPWYVSTTPPPEQSLPVRVLTINMLYGGADTDAIARLAADSADVVMVEELTSKAAKGLEAAGIGRAFPHQALDPRPEAAGTGIYSRYAMTDHRIVDGFRLGLVTAVLRVDGAAAPIHVAAVHTAAPWPQPIDGWHTDLAALSTLFSDLATTANQAPIIVGGDFNATIDMKPFRDLLTNGYRDSAEQAGAGRQFTFPSNNHIPPFIGIDHVLTRNATAVTTAAITVPDSDHRALLATVMVPKA